VIFLFGNVSMQLPTFAIIIGVSRYQAEVFGDLPAARADALHFARSLAHWGIPESNIILLCDSFERKETLLSHLQKLASIKNPFQLVFYFCGHGYRTSSVDPKSYLVFSDSEIQQNKCVKALELETLLHNFSQLNITHLYLFIDACQLRVNTIFNPKLKEEIEGKNDSKKTLFCLLSSGIYTSYEDADFNYGYFTEALIIALAKIRKSDRSPTSLFHYIQEQLQGEELPDSEMYNIGTHLIDFLPPLTSYMDQHILIRKQILADLQDLIVMHRHKAICITGPLGIGKTTLASQLASNLLECYLIPLNSTLDNLRDQLAQALFDSKILHSNASSITLEECLDYLQLEMPEIVLIFDEIQEKNPKKLKEILELFVQRALKIIFLSTYSYEGYPSEDIQSILIEYSLPPLTYQETKLIVRESLPEENEEIIELYHLVSKGHPQKLKQALNKPMDDAMGSQEITELKKFIAAVYSCGLFIDEKLFREKFDLEIKAQLFLEKTGFIYHEEGCWRPHLFLQKMAQSEALELHPASTLSYWSQQFDALPHHFEAALYFVRAVKSFGYETNLDPKLLKAFQLLDHHPKGLKGLQEAAAIFLSPPALTPSSIYLAELFIERQAFDLAKDLLTLSPSSVQMDEKPSISYCHLLWRRGLFNHCIKETTLLIDQLPTFNEKIWCYFHRGAAHYFLGNWDEAQKDFSLIQARVKNPIFLGLAQCLLGTINGIRGIESEASKALIESGIDLLLKEEDFPKAWIGFNNLGEILWKAGDLRASAYYLQKAYEIAQNVSNTSILLETLRNLLQLELRVMPIDRLKLNKLLEKIETTLQSTDDVYELFQTYNTLSTVYFYLGDYNRSRHFLKKAIPLTVQSKEYHIYTLANISLHFKAFQLKEKSVFFLHRARSLAIQGNNHLALRQIESDFALCFIPQLIFT
jgi:tetratricopeptide (TPR) repeat protein